MCPHTNVCVSTYYCVCTSSYYHICVNMCPQACICYYCYAIGVLTLLYMFPHACMYNDLLMHVRSNLHCAINIPFRNFSFNPTCWPVLKDFTPKESIRYAMLRAWSWSFYGAHCECSGMLCTSGTSRCLLMKNWVKFTFQPQGHWTHRGETNLSFLSSFLA